MEEKKKIRFDYLDIAKFIAIFLVILGHTTGNTDTVYFRRVLYSFHMPLFFIVSGSVIRKHQHEYNWDHWKNFLVKNFLGLMFPYLIWSLIYSKFSYNNILYILYGSWQSLAKAETLTSLWYLPCLFIARVLMEVVLMIAGKVKINRHIFAFIISIISFAIGFILPTVENGYFWCFDISFVALGFMLLGYSFKVILNTLYEKHILIHLGMFTLSLGLYILLLIIQGDSLYLVLMCGSDYGNLLYYFLDSILGCIIILSLSIVISKAFKLNPESKIKKLMIWIGQSTLGIYLLHKPFLQEVVMKTFENMGFNLPNLYLGILGAIIALVYSCIIMVIIERFVPQLFGKFPNKKTIKIANDNDVETKNMNDNCEESISNE